MMEVREKCNVWLEVPMCTAINIIFPSAGFRNHVSFTDACKEKKGRGASALPFSFLFYVLEKDKKCLNQALILPQQPMIGHFRYVLQTQKVAYFLHVRAVGGPA